VLVYLPFLLHFAPFSYHFICFFASTRAQIKDPEKVTNKMYGCNTDISSHFFRIFNLRPSNCLQISLFTDLLEGVLSYNPPV